VQLGSKISNLCDPDPPTSQTDGRTTCILNTALCTSASHGKNPGVGTLYRSGRNDFFRLIDTFLPRDASTERGYEIACCLSVCLSVKFRYRVEIGLNSSKMISRRNSLRSMRSLTPNMGDLVQRAHP